MKKFPIFILSIFMLTACRKNEDIFITDANENDSELTGIKGDSIGIWEYRYSDKRIAEIYTAYPQGGNLPTHHYAHIEYLGDSIVKISSPDYYNVYVEYFLMNFKLPLRLQYHYEDTAGSPIFKAETDFFYKPGTNLLDSVNVKLFISNGYYVHYAFEYENQNISKFIRTHFDFNSTDTPYKDTFYFSYDTSTPNIFRQTDSLLYIYENPFADFSYYNMLLYFPKLFSESTIRKVSRTVYGKTIDAGLNYTLTDRNKISKESYNDDVETWLSKEYFYK